MPPSAYERRKDPQKVRAALIEATTTMIAAHGLAGVTVDAVAKAAGVTKGGLFHHFHSKQALIDGVHDLIVADAEARFAALIADDPEPHGCFTRALLNSVFNPHQIGDAAPARTLCLAMLADPALQRRWAAWTEQQVARHAATDDNVPCAIVRLAADGVWLSSLHDADTPPPVSQAVRDALCAMTYPDG
ncbi:MAG: transcriptional regulatory protein TetR family [Sphingomonas bacterium]|uniref:TetR/AcrR family transcriptional regulator n=1 Tax=Sphingomonas bacterium TaxID=1895847 RepID=UPI00262204FF|nr:TetR/AcrR family transcriptional regulator [Sphingomonas bacterium]MDB5696143.1 transcriptional regulatory protein TetR family [Sphingomonas bacterium]